jgi:hypothetical protein
MGEVVELLRRCAWCSRIWTGEGWQRSADVEADRETSTICPDCAGQSANKNDLAFPEGTRRDFRWFTGVCTTRDFTVLAASTARMVGGGGLTVRAVMRQAGIEPATSRSGGARSIP